jgi:hypothetical protein
MRNFIKRYFRNLARLLKSKIILFSGLLIMLIATIVVDKIYEPGDVLYYFLISFVLSFVVQSLLLLRKCYVLYIFRVILFFLIVSQITWVVRAKSRVEKRVEVNGINVKDPVLGFRIDRNIHGVYNTTFLGNDTVYHVRYSTDSLGRRISEDTLATDTIASMDKEHALFLGCSYTFGEGLNYTSTVPFLFAQRNQDYQSYNYGNSGCGPHQMVLFFDEGANTINRSVIKESNGFAIYTFLEDHLNRVYGGSYYLSWANDTPDTYIENGSLVVRDRSKMHLFLAYIINNVGLVRMFHIERNYPKTEIFYKRFADIISYMAKKYWEINPEGDFYIGVYPMAQTPDLAWTKLLNQRIKILQVDPPSDYFQDPDKYKIKHDGHPSGQLNAYYVEKITELMNVKK